MAHSTNVRPNVLVTGSSGHLGTALMIALPSYGFAPIGMDILEGPHTSIIGPITSRVLVRKVFADHPSIEHIIHAATLHKPHVATHSMQSFVETNVLGTLTLLEEAINATTAASATPQGSTPRIKSFIFTSTTSTFGRALTSTDATTTADIGNIDSGGVGVAKVSTKWIDEGVSPIPKNIYGVTKVAAEDICELIHRTHGDKLSILILKTSRFFPEADDEEDRRLGWPDDDNLKVNELTYRRVDIADVVDAHVCAMRRSDSVKWGKYIISAPPPEAFYSNNNQVLERLSSHPSSVLLESHPSFPEIYKQKGWKYMDHLDRVYDSAKARRELGWAPVYTFGRALNKISRGEEWKSELWLRVGKKGYHQEPTGVYTTC